MKKIILFIAALGLFSFLSAQNLGGGWVFGANLSQVDGDAQAGYNQIGLSTGAYVQFQLADWLQVQPEMLYDQLGARSKDGFLNTRFNYISFPMMINATLPIDMGDKIRDLNLQLGPVFGILMNAKDQRLDIPQTESYRRLDLRYAAGATFELSADVVFAARIHYSARSIAKGVLPGFGSGPFHNYMHFSIRWNFVN
jgi:hypothetical protein